MTYKKKLTISYDGTEYGGWQIQPNRTTIQELLENAYKKFTLKEGRIHGAGRTDAGVHARGQVAHTVFEEGWSDTACIGALNRFLPKDIRVIACQDVPQEFHAQYSAKEKIYIYSISSQRVASPLLSRFSYHYPRQLNEDAMQEALPLLIGTQDFRSFANTDPQRPLKCCIRTLQDIHLRTKEGTLQLVFRGEGFLYKMVRNLVGLLLDIGTGKCPISTIPDILQAKDRKALGRTVPAHGLCLHRVIY